MTDLVAPRLSVGALQVEDDLFGGGGQHEGVSGAEAELLQDLLQVRHLRQHSDLLILSARQGQGHVKMLYSNA